MKNVRFYVTIWASGAGQEERYSFTTREEADQYYKNLKLGIVYERFTSYPVFAELSAS
ncbi:hypothetical protein [Hymenobacter cavernae]|uniref:Uncharacterized protein n=1 Tax=Hymenobacter cavernae TaxID=2044852 RepID=A0ABQ1UUC8_9BACT|nr:hypothetical protein [Hymenobacter cavernae]GGF27014.1 hypothetical protein GCM10011383_43230 [Hymenobacter cavernae]